MKSSQRYGLVVKTAVKNKIFFIKSCFHKRIDFIFSVLVILFVWSNLSSWIAYAQTAPPSPFTSGSTTAAKFGTYEVILTGNGSVTNPFDTPATVTFIPPSGTVNAVTVSAFYDGGNTWRARVYVIETGTWQWFSNSPTDSGLNNKSGTFTAINSNLRGLLRKDPANPRTWRSDDGRPFFPIGDTAWYLFHNQEALWQQYVQDDAAKGINVLGPVGALGSPFTGPDSWGNGHNTGNDPWVAGDTSRYDLTKFQNAENRLIWIFNNYPELYIQSQLFGMEWQSQWFSLPQSVRNNTMRYMIARWSAFPNLLWLVSEDQDVTNSTTLAFNREVGNFFASMEPWKHLMSTLPNRFQGFPFTTPSDLNWVGYISFQDSGGPGASQLKTYRFDTVPLHVQFCEDYYEQDYGGPPSGYSDPRFYIRWSFWSWILSGGSYTYGGRWGVIHPYTQTGSPNLRWIGAGGVNYTGYQLHGLDSTPYIWSYFRDRNIDLSLFQPNDNLVTSFAIKPGYSWRPKLMQRGASEFIVYNPNAGSEGQSATVEPTITASMTIDLTSAPGTFQVEWYRPHDGVAQSGGTITGGGLRNFTAPWQGYDVVLRLYTASTPTPTPTPTRTPTPVPTPTPTRTPTPVPTPTPTLTPTPTPTRTPAPMPTPTPVPTVTPTPSPTPILIPTGTPTSTPNPTPVPTPRPNPTSTPTSTPTPIQTPVSTPMPTQTPRPISTATPTPTSNLIPDFFSLPINWGISGDVPIPQDYNGDRLADIAVWRPLEGSWYILLSTVASGLIQPWGQVGDKVVPGDFDGDDKADMAVFQPSTGLWFILNSLTGPVVKKFGKASDIPVPADYDGDGKTDIAVFRPSLGTWIIRPSHGGSLILIKWGQNNDIPVPADYDGDGRADLAVWRPDEGTWYISFSGGGFFVEKWGLPGDEPVPADYDGDGRADLAVWRPDEGTWYIHFSSGDSRVTLWGLPDDIPIPADYNGDGKAELAVWRPGNGTWYIFFDKE